MMNDETSPAEEITETTAEAPKVEDPEEVRAAAKEALAALRENPAVDGALQNLATVSELVKDPSLETDLVAAAQAVVLATLAPPRLPPGTHAHMTVLFSHLLALRTERDAVDALYAQWVRHADAFGVGHATPSNFQQEVFVQRLGDLLGWGLLEGNADSDGVGRFAEWIDSWNPRSKFRVRRVIDMLHRNFPAGGAWRAVHFPSGDGRPPRPQGAPQGGPRGPRPEAKPAGPVATGALAEPAAEGDGPQPAEGAASTEGAQTADSAAQAPRDGAKRRRRRGGRKNRARKEGGAPGAAPGVAGDDDAGNVKPAEPDDGDDDDTQPPGI